MNHYTMLALASLLLAPLASADAAATTDVGGDGAGDPYGVRCQHDSPYTNESREHNTWCFVWVGGQGFYYETGPEILGVPLWDSTSASTTTGGILLATESDGDPAGFDCEKDDDLDHSCWVWVGGQMWVIQFPRLDEQDAAAASSAEQAATPALPVAASVVVVSLLAPGDPCADVLDDPGCEVYCRTHHDYGDCWITVKGFQYRLVLWRPCSSC